MQPDETTKRASYALRVLEGVSETKLLASISALAHPDDGAEARAATGVSAPAEAQQLLLNGTRLLTRLRQGDVKVSSLGPTDVSNLEAVVVFSGRPALLVQNNTIGQPPHPWEGLSAHLAQIGLNVRNVGRVETPGHPELDWVGTGFLVAPRVAITNRHVVIEFAQRFGPGDWRIDPTVGARIDFAEEFEGTRVLEVPIQNVIGVHSTLDLALLGLGDTKDRTGLTLDAGAVSLNQGELVYAVGFPAADSRRNDPAVVQSIFGGIFNVKRLAPGEVLDYRPQQWIAHDCSTLGGNSGSCLVDIGSGVVAGIHYSGRFAEANFAIPSRALAQDATLAQLGVRFAR